MGVRRVGAAPSVKDYVDDESFEQENEDEVPERSSIVQAGWDAVRRAQRESKSAGGGFVTDFKFTDEEQLVKFMSSEPIAVYKQHWIDELRGKGRQSFVCSGETCPLCKKVGHKPKQRVAFSVVNFTLVDRETKQEMPPTAQLLSVGVRAAATLDSLNDGRFGPLDRDFWALSKSGTGTQTTYAFVPVASALLAPQWEMDPEDVAAALDSITPVGSEAIRVDTVDTLREIAAELS